ncbi:hypothetical protein M3Y98_00859200 [Aphelenchoides besseyi]|nr:hypothetical protein M3Y98_00859200 [Aphelenchoides besseyi]KAI6211159.1 hypothetical protein M3Y96_00404400 [Aphelenchoides besseyi]
MFTRSRRRNVSTAETNSPKSLAEHEIELGETIEVDSVEERPQSENTEIVDVTSTDTPKKNQQAVQSTASTSRPLSNGEIDRVRDPSNGFRSTNSFRVYLQKRPQPPTRRYPSILPRSRLKKVVAEPLVETVQIEQDAEEGANEQEVEISDEEEIVTSESVMLGEQPQEPIKQPTKTVTPSATKLAPVRRVYVVRNNETGQMHVNREKEPDVSFEPPPVLKPTISLGSRPFEFALRLADGYSRPLPETNGYTPEDVEHAEKAIFEFTGHLKEIQLKTEQRRSILKAAGGMVDKLIALTRKAKERESSKAEESIRRWIQNEIDNIVEQRLGSIRRTTTRAVWRTEVEKLTDVALTQLMIFREQGTRKQNVLASSLIEFNIAYIQSHKHGYDVLEGIRRYKSNFIEHPRLVRGFTDVCAKFLMKNCHEQYFPVNAEKHALLQHCAQMFKMKIDTSFFTRENGTGKLDRRIRTIRTNCYKKGNSKIPRKRAVKSKQAASGDASIELEDDALEDQDDRMETSSETQKDSESPQPSEHIVKKNTTPKKRGTSRTTKTRRSR